MTVEATRYHHIDDAPEADAADLRLSAEPDPRIGEFRPGTRKVGYVGLAAAADELLHRIDNIAGAVPPPELPKPERKEDPLEDELAKAA